jgi:phosphoenolpyruvate carboxykinase (GTP)
MCERVEGKIGATETPVGYVPNKGDLDLNGLKISDAELTELLRIDAEGWKAEVPEIESYLNTAGNRLPARMKAQLAALKKRIGL